MLPVQSKQMFDGVYTVMCDEGCEYQVAHCDMSLLYNHAEASSWVRNAQTSQLSQKGNETDAPAAVLQQQGDGFGGHPRQDGGTSVNIPAVTFPDRPLCTTATPAAASAGHLGRTGTANMSLDTATAAGNTNSCQEEAEERVVPQLRRTKRTVAQKRIASLAQGPHDPASPGRSVQRKLSHTQPLEASDTSTASAQATKPPACALPVSTATTKSTPGSRAKQKVHGLQQNTREQDSDDDLYVDLSGSNIRSRLTGQQALSSLQHLSSL